MLTRRTEQFLFANCQSISSHFVAVHSWSVRCSRRSQKSINPLILEVRGLSKSLMLIRPKSSPLVLVVIGNMPLVICNRFHKRLANKGKITTFTGVHCTSLWCRRTQVSLNLENRDLDRRNLRLMYILTDFGAICFWNVSWTRNCQKSIKTLFWRSRSSKVIEFGANREPVYDFLLVIYSNLGPISHRYWDTATYWPKIAIFSTYFYLPFSLGGDIFRIMKKLYGS